jgi:phage tail-like protein
MSEDERLYALLPAFYRNRDAEQGQPLRALLSVIESRYAAVHANVQALYDAWFVETCPEWLLPYLADLVGVEGMDEPTRIFPTTRSAVGNAVGYARRKGTAWVLARALRDATGWAARVVEPLEDVGSTQALRDVRPGRGGTVSLRRPVPGAASPSAPARTADLRISSAPREQSGAGTDGRYGTDRLSVYLWRLHSYPAPPADACPVQGGWTVHPGGIDTPLFHPLATLPPLADGPVPLPVPAPLTRDALREALRADGPHPLPLAVWLDGESDPVPAAAIGVADLARWRAPAGARVVVDPERGRLAVPAGAARVRVAYAWGFSADLGGGPYDRRASLTPAGAVEWTATVRAAADGSRPTEFRTLGAALAEWERHAAARPAGALPPRGRVLVLDSARYVEDVGIPPVTGQSLAIEAANGQRPTLAGDLVMRALPAGEVSVNGLYVAGRLHVSGQPRVTLSHCTLHAPGLPSVGLEPSPAKPVPGEGPEAPVLSLRLEHCMTGALLLSATGAELRVSDSILHGDGAAPIAVFQRCTVLGRVHATSLQAVDTLFTGGVAVRDRTAGGVVCCYLGPDSRTPPAEACQPSAAAPGARPVFVSTRFGDPGYAQLSTATPMEVRAGASDGSEMGAFASLRNPQREANLRAALDEYLPAGMRAAVLYAT